MKIDIFKEQLDDKTGATLQYNMFVEHYDGTGWDASLRMFELDKISAKFRHYGVLVEDEDEESDNGD